MARHCGYCGTGGHNRRTCESLTAAYGRQLKNYQQSLDLGHETAGSAAEQRLIHRITYTAGELAKRTGTHPITGKTVARIRTNGPRKCSYCGKRTGHTRRTCVTLIKDHRIYAEATRIARKTVAHRIEAARVGIGTLFTARTGYYDNNRDWKYTTRPFIITRARLDEYTYSSNMVRFVGTQAGSLNVHDTKRVETITLSRLEQLVEGGEDADLGQGRQTCTPAGAIALSTDWLNAVNLNWKNIQVFEKGKTRDCMFIELDDEYSRRYVNAALLRAHQNLGYSTSPSED
jgi:hypothetical protein